jgi:hypothetical protein
MLEDFGKAAAKLSLREGLQKFRVDEDGSGVAEHADDVLDMVEIYAYLAADGGVCHGEQAGGHLHEADSPQVSCRTESAQVAHNPASQTNQQGAAVETQAHHFLPDVLAGFQVLVCLSGGNLDDGRRGEPGGKQRQAVAPGMLIGQDGGAAVIPDCYKIGNGSQHISDCDVIIS